MQRARHLQCPEIPRQSARGDELPGLGIEHRGRKQARGDRRRSLGPDDEMARRAEPRYRRQHDAGRRIAVERPACRGNDVIDIGEFRKRRLAEMRRDQLRHHLRAPGGKQRQRYRVDDAGDADGDEPNQRHRADQVVQVEPFDPRRAGTTDCAEREPAHERRVEHDAGDEGRDEQQAHDAKKQLTRQSQQHVAVEDADGAHQAALLRILPDQLGGPGIERQFQEALSGRRFRRFRQEDVDDIGAVIVPAEHLDVALRIARLGRVDQPAERSLRGIRREFAGRGFRLEEVVDLVMEDQRQPGDAQHQQEQRADQARPFVDERPPFDGSCCHPLTIGRSTSPAPCVPAPSGNRRPCRARHRYGRTHC